MFGLSPYECQNGPKKTVYLRKRPRVRWAKVLDRYAFHNSEIKADKESKENEIRPKNVISKEIIQHKT